MVGRGIQTGGKTKSSSRGFREVETIHTKGMAKITLNRMSSP